MPHAQDERAAPVRTGEEVPVAPLAAYLAAHLSALREVAVPASADAYQVTQFASGYSNLTYLITIDDGVGSRSALVLRRPPVGANIASAHDMGREVKVLRGLARVYELVPKVLLNCEDVTVIGAPFYVMERLHGIVLRPSALQESDPLCPRLTPAVMAQLAHTVIDNLATIHALDTTAAGLADLGRPAGYVARQVQGWTKRYQAAQTDPLPNLEKALRWLADQQPSESGPTSRAGLIHNDYKHDNLMLAGDDLTRLVAVLDWEMCTVGDPLLDLGTTLGYWMEPHDPPALVEMFGLTTLPGNPTRAEVVDRYLAASGCASFDPLFYYVYGLSKIGVILQQIYHRYRQGHSQDARFARLGSAVAACGLMASAAIRQQRISALF